MASNSVVSLLDAIQGDKTFSTVSNVKSDKIADLLAGLYEADKNATNQNEWSIGDLTKKWFATQGERQQQARQEMAALDRFYTGDLANELAGIRAKRRSAFTDATDRALAGITRNKNLGLLGGDSSGGSYANRIALGLGRDAEISAALDAVNQEKSDLNYLTGNQINLAGRRGQIGDAAYLRGLMPGQLRSQEVSRRIGNLGMMDSIDKSNTFYGLKQDRSTLDQVGEVAAALYQAYQEYQQMGSPGMGGGMGGMGGMMGGGGGGGGGGGSPSQANAVRYESMFGSGGPSGQPIDFNYQNSSFGGMA